MDPKTMKRRYDEGQRELAAERERTRYLETQCETLAREVLPVRAYKSAADAAKMLSGRDIADAIRTARGEVGSALEDFARVAASLDRTARAAQDRLAIASGTIDDAVAKLRPEPPAHADLVEALESANAKIVEQDRLIGENATDIGFLKLEIAGLRRDSIAANAEADRALARADAAERRVRDIFYRLTKDMAPGWQGKSLRDLMGDPAHARRMHVLLQRVIDWLNEEAQRPAPKATPADCAYEGYEAPAEPGDVYCSECRASENAEQARIAKIAACAGCYTDEACDIADACPKRGNKTRAERDAVIDDMALPEGRMCGECAFWPSCLAMISSLDPRSRRCDYSPSRWVPPVISNRVKEIKARESAADDDLCGDRPSTLAVTEILDEVAL